MTDADLCNLTRVSVVDVVAGKQYYVFDPVYRCVPPTLLTIKAIEMLPSGDRRVSYVEWDEPYDWPAYCSFGLPIEAA